MGLWYRGRVWRCLCAGLVSIPPPSGEVMGRLCRGRYHLSACDVEIDAPLPPPPKEKSALVKNFWYSDEMIL
jgi:hypothetical protein